MFERTATTKKVSKSLPSHYPVFTTESILTNKKVELLVNRIKSLAYIADDYWEQLYLIALRNFIDFVQGLPAVKYSSFNNYKGWIALGLRRSMETLAAHRRNNPIKNISPEKIPANEALLTYALFTAGLFYGIGQIPATYWVTLCNSSGVNGERWNPIAGNMATQGNYYRYSFEKTNRDPLANYLTPILAIKLMAGGFENWLSCDKDLSQAWLALMQNDVDRGGIIAEMVVPLDLKILQNAQMDSTFIGIIGENDLNKESIESDTNSLFANPADNPASHDEAINLKGTEVVNAFIEWLNKTDLNVNQPTSLLHYTKEGLLMSYPELFKEFIKHNPKFQNPQMIIKALQDAGLAQKQLNQYTTAAKASGMNLSGITKPQSNQQGQGIILDPTLKNSPIGLASKNINVSAVASTLNYPAKVIASNTAQPRRGG
jgi:hypothetical protein